MDPNDGILSYGSAAFKMVQDLARQDRLLGNPFDETGKQLVIDEINMLYNKTLSQTEVLKSYPPAERNKLFLQGELLVQHISILRNKQCLMAYLMARVRMLQSLRWELSSESMPVQVLDFLSPQEKRFKDDYNEILRQYMNDLELDLTLNLHEPPSNADIEVLVLQDYGTIVTEDGSITLQKNTTTVMRRSIAEPLIKMGVLKHVTDGS
jgi:hypothetical protein